MRKASSLSRTETDTGLGDLVGETPHLWRRLMGRVALDRPVPLSVPAEFRKIEPSPLRVGVISNPKSHRNRSGAGAALEAGQGVVFETPLTRDDLPRALGRFAVRKIDLLVIDGGDGTVRDVITVASPAFGGALPSLAVIPSGKTNALALDLGVPFGWTLQAAMDAACAGRFKTRAPMEFTRAGDADPSLRGFLFGAGAFARATALAQRTHRFGAFHGVAVGLSLAGGIAATAFGNGTNSWNIGERMRIRLGNGHVADRAFYILFGTTLKRLPLNVKPFGPPRQGLKLLAIDAPPRRMLTMVPALLSGSEAASLEDAGYHRGDPDFFQLSLAEEFILDGERYEGGDLMVRQGTPLRFAVP